MDFVPVAVDLNPELSNPIVAVSFAVCTALFALALVWVGRSRRAQGRKLRLLFTTLLAGSVACKILPQATNSLAARVHFARSGQHPSIGVIGASPSIWLAPAIALALAMGVLWIMAMCRRAAA